jgi:membrane-associated phospholipid phosphatase|tara:strand:- start:1106 stop:1267 length:162 start_codon:yes stop_codon:yes gene_type:complete
LVIICLVLGLEGLVAMSRVILELHYPTDVVSGAMLGPSFALPSLLVIAVLKRI